MSHDHAVISADRQTCIGHYELLNSTGQGNSAKMTLAQYLWNRTEVVAKVLIGGASLDFFKKSTV